MKFTATIEHSGKTATGIRVPPEVVEGLGAGRRPAVTVTFRGYTYRSTVATMGGVFMLPVSAEVRVGAGVVAGDEVDVEVELDTAPRELAIPEDVQQALDANSAARSAFESLSYSNRRRLIMAIDAANRLITLRDDKGIEDTYTIGPEMKRFDELKVGDKVKMTYYESLVLQVRKPGDKAAAIDTSKEAINRGKGALPSGSAAVQERMTVTVKAIDPAVPSITVTTPDGRTVTRKVENKKNLESVKVGDQIDITYTRALLASIERAK